MRKILFTLFVLMMTNSVWAAAPLRSGVYVNSKTGVMRTTIKKDGKKVDDFVLPFSIALGLRLRHMRVEAEYTFTTKAKKESYEQQTDTIMAQLYYDVPFKSAIRPFFNIGGGRYDADIKQKKIKENRDGWAYNLGGGLTWNVSNAVNIDMGYRYLMIDALRTKTGTVKLQHHYVYFGWRYVF